MSKDEPIKVLHIMSGFGGGISAFIKNKAQALVNSAVKFDVVTYDQCSAEFKEVIQATGGNVYLLQNPKKAGWKAFKSSFVTVLKHNQYDVIHCHIDGYRVLPYRYLARSYHQGKFYIHAHLARDIRQLSFTQHLKLKLNQALNRGLSDAYLGCGHLAIMASYGTHISLDEMMMIPNSVNVDQFALPELVANQYRQNWRQSFQIDKDTLIVGQVARLMPIKNHQFTLALAKQAYLEGRAMKFFLWGAGELEAELKSQVEADPDLKQVILAGRVEDTGQIYPAMDCLILPSLQEGLPTVLVESQAAGLPALASDTITREVDLGLGLVTYLPIQLNQVKYWLDAIERVTKQARLAQNVRQDEVIAHKFSNESSARLYLAFLQGQVQYYQI